MNFIAKNLYFLRKKINLTQAEIAAQFGYKRPTWNNYESGLSQPPLDGIMEIVKHFDISVEDFVNTDLSLNVALIKKYEDGKNQKIVAVNVAPSVALNDKKETKPAKVYGFETPFNHVLNEDQAPYTIGEQLDSFIRKTQQIQANQAKRITELEAQISALLKKSK